MITSFLLPVRPAAGGARRRSIALVWTASVFGASSFMPLSGQVLALSQPADALAGGTAALRAEATGPTLQLNSGGGESLGNAMADFMYFVALISPEPVSIVQSPGNTQRTRMVSATRRCTCNSFVVICEFEFVGQGYQRNVFGHS